MTAARRRGCSTGSRKGSILLADRAYDVDWLRDMVATRGGWANIKPMPTRKRIPSFSPFLYRFRNIAERFFNKIRRFRAIATRFEKHAETYLALVKFAAVQIWLRRYESVAQGVRGDRLPASTRFA